jgi:hypothetical protein
MVIWAVLEFAAVQYCTDWRDEKAKYGFGALALLIWLLPNLLWGETGASEVEQLVLFVGFPVAAIYLAMLLVAEFDARKSSGSAEG